MESKIKRFWQFLQEDSWPSWIVSMIIIIVGIKFIFFPLLAFTTSSSLPLVVVESCSMYQGYSFDEWWNNNHDWYEQRGISKEIFYDFSFRRGLNKGDIIFVWGRGNYELGDIIIFQANTQHPIIHRIVSESFISTKGDNNPSQLAVEGKINQDSIIGKSVFKIPYLGWVKLIFFEFSKTPDERGFCYPWK